MISWPQQLVSAIARRRAVLFLGAGVSRNSVGENGETPPTWQEFLKKAIDRCDGQTRHIRGLINSRDYLTACEILKEKLDADWGQLLADNFIHPGFTSTKIHEYIYALDASLVITPNFDRIYDSYALRESNNTVRIKLYTDTDLGDIARGDLRSILKIHGTIDTPPQMIFTRHEYLTARRNHPNLYALLEALLVTHTFLFIGCSLDDPDMQLFLEKGVHSHLQTMPHYITLPKPVPQDLENSYRRNLNLRVLPYSSANEHLELSESLAQLVSLIEAKRADIAATQRW